MTKHSVPAVIAAAFLWMVSCTPGDDPDSTALYDGEYLVHLQLDSTRLVATELAAGLEIPWDITLAEDGWLWMTKHRGSVARVHTVTGEYQKMLDIPDVYFQRSRGLLSKAIHPDFDNHPHLYFHYSWLDREEETHTRIVRYTLEGDTLVRPETVLDLPGANGHNGSRMMIGPDGKLWVGFGDAHRGDLAQDPSTYHGKVLRMNLDGSVPEDNPFGNRVWSTGHRNIQGITHDGEKIFISEHGPDNDDEVNLILRGRNYGWPDVQGYCDSPAEQAWCRDSLVVEPIWSFNPVVAPAGIEYYGHDAIPEWKTSLLLSTLRIQTLRVLHLDESREEVDRISIYFQQHFGRLRDVAVGPDGTVYLATTNMDWYRDSRPDLHDPRLVENGDRIIMLRPEDERLRALFGNHEQKRILAEDRVALYLGDTEIADDMSASEQLYVTHCASCHRPDGAGIDGLAPPLTGSGIVDGETQGLIGITLDGVSPDERSGRYDWDMPPFRNLVDEELAAILTYIRGQFSDRGGSVRSEEIRQMRRGNPQ